MIFRATSMLVLLYAIGFVMFAVSLGRPASPDRAKTEAAVVITGAPGRIEHGLAAVRAGKADRLLIAGADPAVTKRDLVGVLGGQQKLIACCVDLGSESVDTRSNAEEARRWLVRRKYKSVRLITSDWHMRRARYEFRKELGDNYRLVSDAVRTEPSFLTLFGEYNKYVLRRMAVWVEL